ncbi:UDP-N-acetylmuramoyl-L-alanine--D-glutamate ligase [Pelagibacteraceae bacterium]|jgi:UDP-N-acetylmuramoylalanine--D-glutamate ligase|nr:UDP-N-acetylmuramoyl-L-alanine--D-glutamate ligase [Pelagibacteraceae bacterium]
MIPFVKFKELSFLVYGLGSSGQSVVRFFKKKKIKNFEVWDDNDKKLFKNYRSKNLNYSLNQVDYIILSPGVSLNNLKNKNKIVKLKKKIITDIDLFYLVNKNFKSVVVTGTNGKSTTCKLITHLLQKNKFKVLLGGNIGTPILDLKIKKNTFIVIEASSFQLSHSKFICPDFAILLNITNDHLDWHKNMQDYVNSKLKIFNLQHKKQFAIVNNKFKKIFKKRNFQSRLTIPKIKNYKKIKYKIKNLYLKLNINDENMSYVYAFSRLIKINNKNFINSMKSFVGLPHRYEVFLKKKNVIFINDSKATSFEATKCALYSSKNIYWVLGGLPKKNDKIILNGVKKNIVKAYLIGKSINFFKNQIKNKIKFTISRSLKNSIIKIVNDIKLLDKKNNTILLSPAAASYDQFLNFEKRGEEFKKWSKFYARKYI